METTTNQKVSCIVNYSYDASETDELTIRPGEILRDVERLPGGWWKGELRGRRGMFPDNFVSVVTEQNNARPGQGVQGRCRAVFSYQPANPDELPLCVGDVLEVLGEVEEGWWQGRRSGRVGVFPSNFVVMLEPAPAQPAPCEPAPALPPKPVKEQCRVLFPYTAVNDDELTLEEGEIVNIVSKDAPDRGWWKGELHGRVGLFPDNFVQLLPAVAQEIEEKKPERPPGKNANANALYPILNKYTEKTASIKELTTSKVSMHKENTLSKETSTQSTITHTNKSESEKLIHNETVADGTLDGQVKKPPVPLKKSPTPTSSVGGLFSGLKKSIMSSSEKTEKSSTTVSSGSSSSGEWDRTDGSAASKPSPVTNTANANTNANVIANNTTNTFDHVERNSILNDPRAGRVKAPRRRPPSQVLRDDTPQQIGLTNGHEVPTEKPVSDKAEEVRPRTREWEKHKAPWMEELKLNQAKKTSFGSEGKSRSVSTSSEASGVASKAGGGSTDRILDCGLEEKRSSHSMEMSKSTSSISNRISVLETLETSLEEIDQGAEALAVDMQTEKDEAPSKKRRQKILSPHAFQELLRKKRALRRFWMRTRCPTAKRELNRLGEKLKNRQTGDPKNPSERPPDLPTSKPPQLQSPTAAGRTLTAMLEDIKKPPAPSPPTAFTRTTNETTDKSPNRSDKLTPIDKQEISSISKMSSIVEKSSSSSVEKLEEKTISSGTLERRLHPLKSDKPTELSERGPEALIAQLNNRILNLEKLLEVQNAKFNAAIEDLTDKLKLESDKRHALQLEIEKLAHCVTQV
ncbi:SH3 domain-containing kinase-binding protein 1 isoform X1 [Bicyclus anynana]|uniref:SH3 domain-containing kinase-binding protein 1 isoform X1 n=1 Tax=Bicyclus anynana TaxID=110368 RepID=A0ABM3LNI5_BICAN|nr:SH3 domain-containing kinase-binding protein 1 isoform X1 [Bicyclus anynana]